jgi:hypothetical protein
MLWIPWTSVGSVPFSLFECTRNVIMLDSDQICSGIVPAKELSLMNKLCNKLKSPIEAGMGPFSLFPEMDSFDSRSRDPMPEGSDPVREFVSSESTLSLVSESTAAGMEPKRQLSSSTSAVSVSDRQPMDAGMVPTRAAPLRTSPSTTGLSGVEPDAHVIPPHMPGMHISIRYIWSSRPPGLHFQRSGELPLPGTVAMLVAATSPHTKSSSALGQW